MPTAPDLVIRTATTFAADGAFDDEAMFAWLQRFVDAGLVLYVASSGSGEGSALTRDELGRLYRVAVAAAGGRVRVAANVPDQHTAIAELEHAELAAGCGVDIVQLYGPDKAHGYIATDVEYRAYFDFILSRFGHATAVSPNPIVGFTPSAQTLADIVNKYPQIEEISLTGITSDRYFIELRDALVRDVRINVAFTGSLNTLTMGATGINVESANIVPKTFRRYADLYAAGKWDEIGEVYAQLQRLDGVTAQWKTTSPRVHKMAMRAFRLPGAAGGVRPPFVDLGDDDLSRFTTELIALDIPEIDELAHAAGLGA
jgi:dihydrodipicolinate synthase/N-acetylneuraminate lyase